MKYIIFRMLAGLVLIAAIAAIAILAYNAGVARGEAMNVQIPAIQSGGQANPVYGLPFWWPFPFFGFGFFGLLALLFLLSMAFGAARLMLWGPRFGWNRMQHRYGPWGDEGSGEGVPPMFAEMHQRMHAAEEGKATDRGTQK